MQYANSSLQQFQKIIIVKFYYLVYNNYGGINMKKKNLIICAVVVLIILAVIIGIAVKSNNNENIKIESTANMKNLIDSIYKNANVELPSLETNEIDMSDNYTVSTYTGSQDNSNIESIIVSEPLISSQAYSLVVMKLKNSADVEKVKQNIYDNVNMSKWICVSAEKLYITNYNNIVFYVMSDEDWAQPVYTAFKTYVNNKNGSELEKSENLDYELPDEMLVVE